jgi:predicted nucleotidyltransferase component of viral defense system
VISNDAIIEWQSRVGFASPQHAEQDLVLSRLIVEIANNELLGNELVFRGGTCLHKLHLERPLRYSEDLDYVRSTNTPIGPFIDQLRMIGDSLGMKVNTDISRHPKVFLRADFEDGSGRMRIKIEMNTFETSPAFEPIKIPFSVASRWWSGSTDVKTFRIEELIATKIRALYQRRKGRDLFDLWLALTELHVAPEAILFGFGPYRPDGYTRELAIAGLAAHLAHPSFRADAELMAVESPTYDLDQAGELVRNVLLEKL